MRKANLLVLIAVLIAVAAAPAIAGTHDHGRTGFYIGFGAGWGNAGADLQGLDPDRANSFSGNFRLGWAVKDNVTIGLEASSWLKNYNFEGTTADLTLTGTVTTFALTYFPQNMGFYVRGGLGVATGSAEITDAGFSFNDTETGFGVLGAVGYEWRLTRLFALAPQLQYAYLDIGGDGTDKVDFVSLTAQLTWYW